jgi:hypothetical protein
MAHDQERPVLDIRREDLRGREAGLARQSTGVRLGDDPVIVPGLENDRAPS